MNTTTVDVNRASLLHDGSFVRLCAGQAISAIGDRFTSIAIAVWILTQRDDGAFALGAVFAVRTLVTSVLLIVGGVFADRLSPRAQALGAQLVLAGTVTTLALLPAQAPLVVLLVLFAISGAADAFMQPATQMLVVALAGRERLASANSLTTLSSRVSGLVGPALGGIVVLAVGVSTALLVDAASFGVGAIAVFTTRRTPRVSTRRSPGGVRAIVDQARDGLRVVVATPWLRTVLLSDLSQTFLAVAPWFVLLPIAMIPRGIGAYAFTVTAFAAGGLFGAAVPLWWKPTAIGRAALLSQSLFALPLVALAFDSPLPVVATMAFIGGFGADLGSVLFVTGMQQGVPTEMLGRITALSSLGSIALLPAGFALAGALAQPIGVRPILVTGVLVILVATAVALRTRGVAEMGGDASREELCV